MSMTYPVMAEAAAAVATLRRRISPTGPLVPGEGPHEG